MDGAPATRPYVGGQAVIEGVMMRSPRSMAVAARRPDGTIVVKEAAWISLFERLRFLRWPLIRGSVVLLESLFNGIQALNFSTLVQAEEITESKDKSSEGATKSATPERQRSTITEPASKSDQAAAALMIAISFVLALGIFVALPHLLAWGAGAAMGSNQGVESFGFHALDGLFKISIFVGYIVLIGRIPEIARVFQYHGAEHKAINAYEHGEDLTVDNARRWTTFHARCGTSFVLFVLVLSIFMFAAVLPFVPAVSEMALLNHLAMVAIKIPLMLPLAGIAYEINKYAANHPEQWWVQALVVPGRMMQKLTTKEPTDEQLEIALAAMRAAVRREAELAPVSLADARSIKAIEAPLGGRVIIYRDFGEVAASLPTG